MFGECPHCHRRVLPLANGECPSCHMNTKDVENTNQDETMLAVSEATQFPKLCCSCNQPTTGHERVTRSGKLAGVTPAGEGRSSDGMIVAGAIFNPIGALLGHLFASALRKNLALDKASLTVLVPRCDKCVATKPIDVSMVDLEHYRLGIIVNRQFAAAVEETNRR